MIKFIKVKAVFSWTLFILKYWVALIIVFQVSRTVFLTFNLKETKTIGIAEVLLSAWFGLTMDISIATYVMVPVILFLILAIFFKFFRKTLVLQIYTGLILFFILFLLIVDLAMYKTWGFRLDATPLKYISHPQEAWASIQHQPLGMIMLVLLFVSFLLIIGNNKLIRRNMSAIDYSAMKFQTSISLLVILGVAIIPIRGGLQLQPINQSSVYFSANNFANQAALNGPWNLLYSLTHAANEKTNPYSQISIDETKTVLSLLLKTNGKHERLLIVDSVSKPNVIIIIWEGLTAKVIDAYLGGKEITPHFNALKNEGVYFSNLYASGDRTDKGLVAVLSGYPSNPQNSIIKVPLKAAKLPMLGKEFQKRNFNTSFYYGGEIEFANMKAYLMQGGFRQIVSIHDFDKKDLNSKWGAHDEVVMNRILGDIAISPQPFFYTWLTLSSHEPFEVPAAHAFKAVDEEGLYLNSLHYTDSIFGAFIQKLKKSALWENTVILTVADHGSRMPKASFKANDFKIGGLLIGGAVDRPRVINSITSQVDLAALISDELGFDSAVFPWSRNVLDTTKQQWSFFSFNNGFGYAEPLGTVIYDNVGKRVVQSQGNPGDIQLKRGKALQQSIYQDYLDK